MVHITYHVFIWSAGMIRKYQNKMTCDTIY
jgi:hypothetical protein